MEFSKQLGSSLSQGMGDLVGLGSPGQVDLRLQGTMMWAMLCEILWTNEVVKWRDKVCLDLKTTMML